MYNKLFTKILDSSIWLEPTTTRIVWLTFIATMDETGFVAFAAPGNVANRARVELSEAEAALAALEAPDPNSSDPDNDGRRIERVPGGWMVLNAPKYRELVTRDVKQQQIRRRVAEFRSRKRLGMDAKIAEQSAKCGCCGEPFEEPYSLYVVQDHNHESGETRGVICQSCNKLVGLLELGKPTISTKTECCKSYIEKWKGIEHVTQMKRKANELVTTSEAEAETEAKSEGGKQKPPFDEKILWEGKTWWPSHLQKQLALVNQELVGKEGEERKLLKAKRSSLMIALGVKIPTPKLSVLPRPKPERPPPTPEEGRKIAEALRKAVEQQA